jgi:hypothetical protein
VILERKDMARAKKHTETPSINNLESEIFPYMDNIKQQTAPKIKKARMIPTE